MFGCISSQGYKYDDGTNTSVCKYNGSGACGFAVGIGVIAFLASSAFLVGDALFDQFSNVKTRKHYVMADLGFSGECGEVWNESALHVRILHSRKNGKSSNRRVK